MVYRSVSWLWMLLLVGTIALTADAQERLPVAYTSRGNSGGGGYVRAQSRYSAVAATPFGFAIVRFARCDPSWY